MFENNADVVYVFKDCELIGDLMFFANNAEIQAFEVDKLGRPQTMFAEPRTVKLVSCLLS